MPLPELTIGLVVRYEYLWARRAAAGTADKDHPACIVGIFQGAAGDEASVVYLPISHTPPQGDDEGIELTERARAIAGLDDRRQWVLISECNVDIWPCDLRTLPGRPGRFHYGHLPPSVFRDVRDRFLARYRAKRFRAVGRSQP